jgi:hypothetical protein
MMLRDKYDLPTRMAATSIQVRPMDDRVKAADL